MRSRRRCDATALAVLGLVVAVLLASAPLAHGQQTPGGAAPPAPSAQPADGAAPRPGEAGPRTSPSASGAPSPDPASPAGSAPPAGPAATTTAPRRPPPPATDTFVLRSPLCEPAHAWALSAAQRAACARTGSPLAGAPITHYAFDVNWDPPITDPAGVAIRAFYDLLNMLWLGLLFCLRGVMTLLDWAFALNPFEAAGADGERPMGALERALARFFAVVDAGFFSAVIACVGLWGMWEGIVRRRAVSSVAGVLAATAMLVAALVVVHLPDRTVGMVARLANQTAMGFLAAPSRGLDAPPTATYGEAMRGLFDDVVRAPWCALNFRTQAFCAGRPEHDALSAALDAGGDDEQHPAVESNEAGERSGSRAELWLAFAPASAPREGLYRFYAGHDASLDILGIDILNTPIGDQDGANPDEVAIQGEAGGLTRLPLLLVIAIGVLGALLLLGWLMLRLLGQATVALILLLLTPVAFLFPALGEAGRTAFLSWGRALLGAIVSKVVYAALLGVAVLASSLLGGAAEDGNWWLAWLLQSGLWWTVFLKRDDLLAVVSIAPDRTGRGGSGLTTLYRLERLGRDVAGAVTGPGRAARNRQLVARQVRSDAVRQGARDALTDRAERRDAHVSADAHAILRRDRELGDELGRLQADAELRRAREKTERHTAEEPHRQAADAERDARAQRMSPTAPDAPVDAQARPRGDAGEPSSVAASDRDGVTPTHASPGRSEASRGETPPASDDRAAGTNPTPPGEAQAGRSGPAGGRGAATSGPRATAPSDAGLTDTERSALERHARLTAERAALAPAVTAARAALAPDHAHAAGDRHARAARLDRLRRELQLPAHDHRHAWRVWLSPHAFTQLARDDPATHAHHVRTITGQLQRDRALVRALPTDPRTPPRPNAERAAARQLNAGRLRALRHDRRDELRHERALRRYLSR